MEEMVRPAWIALAALALIAACAPAPTSGLAGCWERAPDGRTSYRDGWAPTSAGMCPTRREMLAAQDYAAQASAIECRAACKVGLGLMLLRAR